MKKEPEPTKPKGLLAQMAKQNQKLEHEKMMLTIQHLAFEAKVIQLPIRPNKKSA